MQTDLYRIDDMLLRAGLFAGVIAAVIAKIAVDRLAASGIDPLSLLALIAAIACPLTLLVAGWFVRRRERLIVDLWRLIEAHGEVSVAHLCRMSSFSRGQLSSAIRRINRRGRGLLVWDEGNGVIRAGGHRQRHTLTHSEDCRSCGATVNIEVGTDNRDGYRCPYCNGGLDSERINELLGKLHVSERHEQSEPVHRPLALVSPARREGSRINMTVFVVLLLLFWPGAVIYALHKYLN